MNTSRFAPSSHIPFGSSGDCLGERAPSSKADALRPGGFILVAVLLLIALVTVLVVVTSLLARVERNAVTSETNTELARQNALFGLDVALAQLQKTAGPDQRITARADICDSDFTTLAMDFPGPAPTPPPGQAYWTGVWTTGSAPPDASYAAALPTPTPSTTSQRSITFGNALPAPSDKAKSGKWLVSDPIDPSTSLPLVLNPFTVLPSSIKTVTLAKNLPDLTLKSSSVNVGAPLVSIYPSAATATPTATPSGKYAYWVSDEGVKAKPNLVDPTYAGGSGGNSAFVESQLHFAASQSVATQDGLLGANAPDLRDPRAPNNYAADLPKVTSLQSLSFVQGTASAPAVPALSGSGAAQFSPDVTTCSYGVLSDVRNGGLKVDLSQLFEDPSNQFSAFLSSLTSSQNPDSAADQKVWEALAGSYNANNQSPLIEFGVRWQSLYNYYSLYKNVSTYPSLAPWSNLNYYSAVSSSSAGDPGTNTPSIDERVFGYSSNPTGKVGGTPALETGEYYLPHILAFGVYFSMSSQQQPPTGSVNPQHDYNLILYAEPRLILYNPYNVNLTVSKLPNAKPYALKLTTNVLGSSFAVSVNGTTVITKSPTWSGTGVNPQDLTFITDTAANFVLKPGEIRAYGLGTLTGPTSLGNVVVFNKIGDKLGQSQWQYLGTMSQGPPIRQGGGGTCPTAQM